METLHNINTTGNKSNIRLRSVLALAGIVIAIICSLVSLKEIQPTGSVETKEMVRSIETPKFVNTVLANTASTIWSLRDRI